AFLVPLCSVRPATSLAALQPGGAQSRKGCYPRSCAMALAEHRALRRTANQLRPSAAVPDSHGPRAKHPVRRRHWHSAWAALSRKRTGMVGPEWTAILPLCVTNPVLFANSDPTILTDGLSR